MAIHIKRTAYLSLVALCLTAGSAYRQSSVEPKLVLQNVNVNPVGDDGFYNAGVGLGLTRGPNNPQINFNVSIQHVRSLDEVYDKLKPALDDLSKELKTASENFHPPH